MKGEEGGVLGTANKTMSHYGYRDSTWDELLVCYGADGRTRLKLTATESLGLCWRGGGGARLSIGHEITRHCAVPTIVPIASNKTLNDPLARASRWGRFRVAIFPFVQIN